MDKAGRFITSMEMRDMKIVLMTVIGVLALTGCAFGGPSTEMPEAPEGATAWCGGFTYTGTFTKSEGGGQALGVSDSELVNGATIDDIIALADAMGCSR